MLGTRYVRIILEEQSALTYLLSLNVKINFFKNNIFVVERFIIAEQQFNIISSWVGQGLTEPWRRVKGTAGTTDTASTIPEWVIC